MTKMTDHRSLGTTFVLVGVVFLLTIGVAMGVAFLVLGLVFLGEGKRTDRT